jgi:hypothetical protein
MKHIIEGDVEADSIDIEDGGSARIASIYPDGSAESGMFVRVQSWDEKFCYGEASTPSHPDFEKLFGGVDGTYRRSTLTGKKRVRVTIEILD